MGAKYIRDGFHHVIPAQVGQRYKPSDNSMRKGLAMVRVWGVLDVILQDLTPDVCYGVSLSNAYLPEPVL